MDAALRELVRRRADDRCEYCHIRQDQDSFFRFHIEHIVPRQHGGATSQDNLALSCHHCNLHKGPNLSGIDPVTRIVVTLFDPRRQVWDQHFGHRGNLIVGQTPTGRATVRVLAMNAPARIELRAAAQES
jgi:hypothetical protein